MLFKIALFVGLPISFHFYGFFPPFCLFCFIFFFIFKHILCVFVYEWCECECVYDDFHIFSVSFSSCQFELWNLWSRNFCSTLNLFCRNNFLFFVFLLDSDTKNNSIALKMSMCLMKKRIETQRSSNCFTFSSNFFV